MKRRNLTISITLFAAVLLSSCQGQPFSESDFNNKLFPNGLWDLIIQLAAFVILLILVFLLGYKPLKKMLDKRKEYVQNQLDEAEKAKKTISDASLLAQQEIDKGKQEASTIIQEAKAQASVEAASIINEAKEQASAKRRAADEEIKLAQEASKQEIRQEIIDVALQASSQILARNVDDKDNQRMVDELLSSLDGGK